VTITPTPDEQGNFQMFRLGIWPNFFPGVQFPTGPDALDQFVRQETPNTGPDYMFRDDIVIDAAVALFERIGPAVLLTHSAAGRWGWFANKTLAPFADAPEDLIGPSTRPSPSRRSTGGER